MTETPKPLPMRVDRVAQVTQILIGVCPACGDKVGIANHEAVALYEQHKDTAGVCPCGQALLVQGAPLLVDPMRVVVPGVANNRAMRRRR